MPVQELEPTSEGLVFQRLQALESNENKTCLSYPLAHRDKAQAPSPFPRTAALWQCRPSPHMGTGVCLAAPPRGTAQVWPQGGTVPAAGTELCPSVMLPPLSAPGPREDG